MKVDKKKGGRRKNSFDNPKPVLKRQYKNEMNSEVTKSIMTKQDLEKYLDDLARRHNSRHLLKVGDK